MLKVAKRAIMRVMDAFVSRNKFKVISISFINNGHYPLQTDLSNIKPKKFTIHQRFFKDFVSACIYVARLSKLKILRRDILVVEVHGLEDGQLVVGYNEKITLASIARMCEDTNISTVILACCYGDRVFFRGDPSTSKLSWVYSVGELYDNDAMVAVSRMIESLDAWDIKKSVRVISSGTNSWVYVKGD